MKENKTKKKKAFKVEKRSIVIDILNDEYEVVVCWGDKKWLERIVKSWGYRLEEYEDGALDFKKQDGTTFREWSCHPVICLPRRPKNPKEIETLAHEAVHAVEWIFRRIEEKSRDEVFAHSVGAIVRKVLANK